MLTIELNLSAKNGYVLTLLFGCNRCSVVEMIDYHDIGFRFFFDFKE